MLPRLLVGLVGVTVYACGLIGGAFLGLGTILPLMVIWPAGYRACLRFIRTAWGFFLAGVMRYWYGTKLILSGSQII